MIAYVATAAFLISVCFLSFHSSAIGNGTGRDAGCAGPAREFSSFLHHQNIAGCQRSLFFQFCFSLAAAISMLISPLLALGNVDKCLSSAGALILCLQPL